jgi:hypothetical protein
MAHWSQSGRVLGRPRRWPRLSRVSNYLLLTATADQLRLGQSGGRADLHCPVATTVSDVVNTAAVPGVVVGIVWGTKEPTGEASTVVLNLHYNGPTVPKAGAGTWGELSSSSPEFGKLSTDSGFGSESAGR